MADHRRFNIGIKSIITNTKGEILLLFNIQNSPGSWDIPGGRMEIGESVEQTLKRELKEETGITEIKSSSLFHAIVTNAQIPSPQGELGLALFIYKVEVADTAKIILSPEHEKYEWVSPTKAAELFANKFPKEFIDKLIQ